jgi:hypothetical protein
MKSFGLNAAALGGTLLLGALVAPASAQELLTNANLDATSVSSQVLATPTNWVVDASRVIAGPFNDGASSEPWCNVFDPGGFGLFFKPFTGGPVNGNVTVKFSQTVAGSPGLPYTLRGWAGAEPNYVGLSDPAVQSLMELEFLDAGNNLISAVTLDLRAAGLGVGAPTPPATGFAYHEFSVAGISPVGTASVRASVSMVDAYANPLGGGQAFVVDAFSLTVPEPASLGLAAIAGLALLPRRR